MAELHVEPFEPFGPLDTLRSAVRWPIGAAHLGAWLGVFWALDRTVLSGQRFDRFGKWVARRVTDLAGIRVEQHGLDRLHPDASYVFCINHVSLFDLFVVFQSIPHFHRSFQDARHFGIPIYGKIVRIFGQLPVDKQDRRLTEQSFRQARQMLERGASFVVFPEGHRTRDGRLGRFYLGAFRLAQAAGVPVVPVALQGLRNLCPAGEWRWRSGVVHVRFGDPMASVGQTPESLAERTRTAIDALLATPC